MVGERQKLNATFFAFRKREKRGVLLGATLVYGISAALIYGAFVVLNWGRIEAGLEWLYQFAALGERAKMHPELVLAPSLDVLALFGLFLLLLIPMYILAAAYEAACLRWFLRGETGGLFGLKLDADTWRCYGGYWAWFGVSLGAGFARGFIVALISLLMWRYSPFRESGEALVEFGLNALLVYFVIRFSPGNAKSVGAGRFAFFDAWSVTRDRSASLLASYAIAAVIYAGAVCAVFGAGYALLWPMLAPFHDAAGGLLDWAALKQMVAQASASQGFVLIAAGLGVALLFATLMMRLCHFGISARAVLDAQREGARRSGALHSPLVGTLRYAGG
jgi:hypothetical protein